MTTSRSWPSVFGTKRRADCSRYLRAESPFDARARKDIDHEGAIGINPDRRRLVGSNRGPATISNCYSRQQLEQPLNVGARRHSAWRSKNIATRTMTILTFC